MKYFAMVAALFALAPATSFAEVKYDQHIKIENGLNQEVKISVGRGERNEASSNGKADTIKPGKSHTFKHNNLKEKFGKSCSKNCSPREWTKTYRVLMHRMGERSFETDKGVTNFCEFTMYYSSNKKWTKVKSRNVARDNNTCDGIEFSSDDGKTVNLKIVKTNL
ncbi:MAG: hypothetical protein KC613_22590 [Myxococcales bacterium]|nr:hypothetical protein [Myxococcales bacterium]